MSDQSINRRGLPKGFEEKRITGVMMAGAIPCTRMRAVEGAAEVMDGAESSTGSIEKATSRAVVMAKGIRKEVVAERVSVAERSAGKAGSGVLSGGRGEIMAIGNDETAEGASFTAGNGKGRGGRGSKGIATAAGTASVTV